MDRKQKTFCIICGKEKNGVDIRSDPIIDGLRWIKTNITHNHSNNRLVVCRDCYEKYRVSKKRFDSRKKLYLILGIIFAAFILIVNVTIFSIAFALFMIALLYLFALFNYVPDLAVGSSKEKGR